MKVSQVMNKVVVEDESLTGRQAARIMSDKNIGSLIIMKKDKITGIVTENDIVKNLNRLDRKITEIMSKDIVAIDKNDTLEHAALLMKENKIKRLPVVDNGDLAGLISITDIIANIENLNEEFFFD